MKFAYVDLEGKTKTTSARITTNSSLSSYGQPVIVLEDGTPLDLMSYLALSFNLVEATRQEKQMFNNWLKSSFPIGL